MDEKKQGIDRKREDRGKQRRKTISELGGREHARGD